MTELPIERQNILGDNIGYVALTAVMGDDRTPARTARTSFRNADKERSEEQDAKLTKYLIEHGHWTPVEFVQLRYYVKQPISVARQAVRSRTQSINEVSYRYVTAQREFYVPQKERMRGKSANNKQGSSDQVIAKPEEARILMTRACNFAFDAYEELLAHGLAPETARGVLPVNTYTEWYTQMSMRNFLHFAGMRCDPHAQWEIRQYSNAMLEMAEEVYPGIIGAWKDINAFETCSD